MPGPEPGTVMGEGFTPLESVGECELTATIRDEGVALGSVAVEEDLERSADFPSEGRVNLGRTGLSMDRGDFTKTK